MMLHQQIHSLVLSKNYGAAFKFEAKKFVEGKVISNGIGGFNPQNVDQMSPGKFLKTYH